MSKKWNKKVCEQNLSQFKQNFLQREQKIIAMKIAPKSSMALQDLAVSMSLSDLLWSCMALYGLLGSCVASLVICGPFIALYGLCMVFHGYIPPFLAVIDPN